MLTLNQLSYIHANGEMLLDNIDLTINRHDKIALIGHNGTGKSSLLKIMAGQLLPTSGNVIAEVNPYYVPQHFGQFNDHSIAEALGIDLKLKALKEIMDGRATEKHLLLLNDDWLLEERCTQALADWKLEGLDISRKLNTLSGGQITRLLLAGIAIHQPEMVLLDEPSNYLDDSSRERLYEYIKTSLSTLIVVSHDRTLLNLLNLTFELSRKGISSYGGNYNFYEEQRRLETDALHHDLKNKEKSLRKAREIEKESLKRKQKLDARGKNKQEKAGLPTILINTFKNSAEKSAARLKDVHAGKIEAITEERNQLKRELPDIDRMKMDLDNAHILHGKRIVEFQDVNFSYSREMLWKEYLNFSIRSGERVAIKGDNGSGKTTLIKLILGRISPNYGQVDQANIQSVYIDHDYSLIQNQLTVYEQVQQFNDNKLPEHELKTRLNRFLFTKEYWDKLCITLSGGEKMRLMLCCLMVIHQAPDMIVLDEPTNNLDLQNVEILTSAISNYKGTLIVVSHDRHFLKQVNVEREILLQRT